MPPKAAVARLASPSPPPLASTSSTDQNDILIIQDLMDTIDQIPIELTRVHSDLNELGAVLYTTLLNLEHKLHRLIDWVQNPNVRPEQRFLLLQEIAEEAARYKLGGDDKIRVAGGACDGIMGHQRHITELLNASTLLDRGPPSPYSVSITLGTSTQPTTTRRGGRTTGSPFNDRGTPTKRKKSRKDVLGREDDDASSINGDKRKGPAKRKKTNRGVSPSESVASNTYGKPAEPIARTARQIAAAAAKARAAARVVERDDSDEDTGDDEPRRKGVAMAPSASADSLAPGGALGIDIGTSREGSAGKSGGVTPSVKPRARKRGQDDDEDDDDDDDKRPVAKKAAYDDLQTDVASVTEDTNEAVYCICRQIDYGEMIGCDAPPGVCKTEWFHISCVGLSPPLPDTWYCPDCVEALGLASSDGTKSGGKTRKSAKSTKRR